jgi:hypothetical protein
MSPRERAAAAVVGLATTVAGTFAVFLSDNEIGTAGLLLIGVLFLVMAVSAATPTGFKWGDQEVTLERIAVQRLIEEAPADVQAEILAEALTVDRRSGGAEPSVARMLARFSNHSGSTQGHVIHDELESRGWSPKTPSKSTYILWTYRGDSRRVSLYQNSQAIVVAMQAMRPYAATLQGHIVRANGEIDFDYLKDSTNAIAAIDALTAFADGRLAGQATSQ